MNPGINIRKAEKSDCAFILQLNAENVEVLSPLTEEKLDALGNAAELFLVAESEGKPAAFLIALREGISFYESENYRWFSSHYDSFLYIDRVVIDKKFRHLGAGRAIYEYILKHAEKTGVPVLTAEVDLIPYNETSLAFHKAMGFKEVGVQVIRGGEVKVSLQERKVLPPDNIH